MFVTPVNGMNTKKTSNAKQRSIKKWREKQFKNQKCRDCIESTNAADSRCPMHKRWHQIRVSAMRQFMKDFK